MINGFVFSNISSGRKSIRQDKVFSCNCYKKSKTGYIYEPKKAVNRVVELSGVLFTLHDLRRTFATIADSLDLPAHALKRLLNHKMGNDVTAGYIMRDVERLRKPMQRIADFLLKSMYVDDLPVTAETLYSAPVENLTP